ncbi:MAG: LysR substrate-binding domain-containing protein, partial [Patulibacter sp.]|nr:LysR substrate-binding domain-containing protein [Patulibacter sp.]
MDLETRHLRYFVAVAEARNFTRAAEQLHMAQPALSTRIRELEERLGVTLFERTTRRVDLTAAGEALLERAHRLLSDHHAAVLAVREAGGAPTTLRLGLMGSSGAEIIGPLLRRLGERLPGLEVTPVALVLPAEVEHGDADIAFARLRPEETELEVEILVSEGRALAMAADHPFAARDELRMADLVDEAFLTQPAAINPTWREAWLAEQHRHGLPGRIAAEVHDAGQLFGFLASGRGVCLVPAAAARAMARPGVAFVPVVDADPAVVSLVWRPGAVSPGLVRTLTAEARALL